VLTPQCLTEKKRFLSFDIVLSRQGATITAHGATNTLDYQHKPVGLGDGNPTGMGC
jgi:hypothetical protein